MIRRINSDLSLSANAERFFFENDEATGFVILPLTFHFRRSMISITFHTNHTEVHYVTIESS